jgi:hypothetical protein
VRQTALERCPACGAQAEDGKRYCTHCGTSLLHPPDFIPKPGEEISEEDDEALGELPTPDPEDGKENGGRFMLVVITSLVVVGIVLAFFIAFVVMDSLDMTYETKRFVGEWEITKYGMNQGFGYANITAEEAELFIDLTFAQQGNLDVLIDVERGVDIQENTHWELKGEKVDIKACYTIPWLSFEGPLDYEFLDNDRTLLLQGAMSDSQNPYYFVYTLEKRC